MDARLIDALTLSRFPTIVTPDTTADPVIERHDFNSRWWGEPVGVCRSESFFDLPQAEQQQQLAPYEWVEYKSVFSNSAECHKPLRSGFYLAGVQIGFRIRLNDSPQLPETPGLEVRFADDEPFRVQADQMRSFQNERFLSLPGVTVEKLNQRYEMWGNLLAEANPASCVRLTMNSQVQGWFFTQPAKSGLDLTLAMLHRDAVIDGAALYASSFRAFAARGARLGFASFSAANTPVHNILALLGARFTGPTANWMWTPR